MTEEQLAALGLSAGLISAISLVIVVLWVLLIIAHWKMFTKADEKGWKSLIPIYSDYTLFKLVWAPKWFGIFVAATFAMIACNFMSGDYALVDGQLYYVGQGNFIFQVLSWIAQLITLYCVVQLQVKTSFAYGKGLVMALVLLFLPNVGTLMLAFGSAEYEGPDYHG